MNKKGITLIALSITILVMTILSAAAVDSVMGIVKLVRKDGYETTSRILREQMDVVYKETMSKVEGDETFTQAFNRLYVPMLFESPAVLPTDFINAIPETTITTVASRVGITEQELLSLSFYKVDDIKTKELLNIETTDLNFYVNFEKNIAFSISPIKINDKNVYTLEEIDSNFSINNRNVLISQIKVGDTVIYDPTKGVTDTNLLKHTSPVGSAKEGENVSGNGYSVQTITATSSHNQYLVIGKENGRLKLMAKNVTAYPKVTLKSGQGYLYAEEELHKMCSVFGHGIGADQSNVTTYTIGNHINPEEVKTKKLRNSGARSITLEDLEKMTTVNLRGTQDRTNPTEPVFYPTLYGTTVKGICKEGLKKANLPLTGKSVSSGNFVLKPEYSNIAKSNIYSSTYFLANKDIAPSTTTSQFLVKIVNSSNITTTNLVTGTTSDFQDATPSYYLRPVVFLSPDVKLKATSTAKQWEVVQ